MFTGIIKEVGRVERIVKGNSLSQLGVRAEKIYNDALVSDSISVNGVCLTLIYKEKKLLFFEVIESTLKKTNLKHLKKKDYVNLEPALKIGEKLSGHFVLGHIDGEVRLRRIIRYSRYYTLEIELPPPFKKFIFSGGSVALEGISLTVKKILPSSFTVDIIPFTYNHTNLKYKRTGDWLNVEFDYLIKSKTTG